MREKNIKLTIASDEDFVVGYFRELPEEVRQWPAPGSEDTELGILMEPEVGHGEAEVYARVQA